MNTIAVTSSGFALSGPLVAGEPVAVSVSGVEFADGARPCLTIRARFPNALLASADLAWDANAGAWTGTIYTATKQTVLAFLTARADEARPVALELLDAEHSESIARISASMLNSSLLPTDNPPDAQGPEYIGVPGPRGEYGLPGPLRGRQYAYTVEDGDTIALPADATSVVLSASVNAEITITPPAVADGADWGFWILGADGTSYITANIAGDTGTAPQVNQYSFAVAMKRGSGAFSFVFS